MAGNALGYDPRARSAGRGGQGGGKRRPVAAKPQGEEKRSAPGRGITPARIAAIGALLVVVIVLAIVLFSGGGGHKYTLLFQNAGQLVPDNQVMIGGSPVGTVSSIELSPSNLAEIKIEVEQELHEGTTAVIRATSLSGVANHYVSISPGPNSSPALEEGAELGLSSTTTPVDIDQLFNSFPPKVREGLQNFIKGNAQIYAGRGKEANESYKYFGTALNRATNFASRTERRRTTALQVPGQLEQPDQRRRRPRGAALERDLQRQHRLPGDRTRQNVALDESLQELPPVLRQSNTTFVNLRAALDDVEPLINTAKPATKNLAPFLAELRPVLSKFIPFTQQPRPGARAGPASTTTRPNCWRRSRRSSSRPRTTFPHAEDRDRRLPAAAELPPLLHAGHLQRDLEARPGQRLLRRQRPLRPRRRPALQNLFKDESGDAERRSRRAEQFDAVRRSARRPRSAAPAAPRSRPPTTRPPTSNPPHARQLASARPNATPRRRWAAHEKADRRSRRGGRDRRRDRPDRGRWLERRLRRARGLRPTARSWSTASRCASPAPTSARSSRSASRCPANRRRKKTASSSTSPARRSSSSKSKTRASRTSARTPAAKSARSR